MVMQKMKRIVCVAVAAVLAGAVAEDVQLNPGTYRAAPGGGLLSTPQDMIKFFQMIARGGLAPDGRRLISAPLMEKWTSKQTPKCVKVGYSFGMKVDGKGSLSHGGAGGTWAEANVKTRKARLYMVNVQGSSKVAKSFRDDWMKKTALSAKKAK